MFDYIKNFFRHSMIYGISTMLTKAAGILDGILKAHIEQGLSSSEIIEQGFDAQTVIKVIQMVDRNEYKRRQCPLGIKITPKAFGKDRRMPITNRYRHNN